VEDKEDTGRGVVWYGWVDYW